MYITIIVQGISYEKITLHRNCAINSYSNAIRSPFWTLYNFAKWVESQFLEICRIDESLGLERFVRAACMYKHAEKIEKGADLFIQQI